SGGAEAAWRSRCAVNSPNRPTTTEIGLVRAPAAHTSSPSPRPDGDESSCHRQNGRSRMSHTHRAGNYWSDIEFHVPLGPIRTATRLPPHTDTIASTTSSKKRDRFSIEPP